MRIPTLRPTTDPATDAGENLETTEVLYIMVQNERR